MVLWGVLKQGLYPHFNFFWQEGISYRIYILEKID